MPKISESDAYSLAQGIDTLNEIQKPRALEILTAYRQQQDDNGEPHWPSQVRADEDQRGRLRGMFKDLKTVDKVAPAITGLLPYSENPDADRARVAITAYMAKHYGKTSEEIGAGYELYKKDYGTRFLQSPQLLDDLAFHKLAGQEIQREELTESAKRDGINAALRGDDVVPALQAWQQKNGMERMPDSTQFTSGFLQARSMAGDHLEFAGELLKQIESNIGMTKGDGAERPAPASREMASQFEASLAALAEMKPRDRKQVYAIVGAKAEAAGYDQKGFWTQMLSYAGKQMARAGDTTTTALSDLAASGAAAEGAVFDAGAMGRFQQGMDTRGKRGVIFDELADIASGKIDPVKPVLSWMNDSLEKGLIQGPGAIAPFMMTSAALGPIGGGLMFTADFAEQNRRDLVRSGMDDSDARLIGMAAAPMQAAVESLSNGLQLGRFPAVQRALAGLTKPISGGAGMLTRYGLNSAISFGSEFTEEQLQDNVIRPTVQNVVAAFDEDVPQVGIGQIWENIKASSPELLFTLAPMALVFGGTMTAAQANLSSSLVSSQDMLEAAGYSAAQANAVRAESSPDAQISKAREMWGSRAGTPASMETAAKSVAERMRMLQTDHMAAQQDLEQRGILPRMLRASEDGWRLTFNDGSTADFNTHSEANAARWQWATDQLGKVHLATREALAQMESQAAVGREFAVEFKPDVRLATQDEMASPDFQDRIKQGSVLDSVSPEEQYADALAIDKASGGDVAQQILGSSVNTFKDGILTTTMRLYEGADITTLVEEKLEGDSKAIMSDPDGRQWMLEHLRSYEQASGDKLFATESDAYITDKMLAEAWSHLGKSYLVGKSTDAKAWQGNNARRMFRYIQNAGLSSTMNAETQYWRAVAIRAQKINEVKKAGKLGPDLVAELEKQLGIDSQAKFEQQAAQEAQSIATEALSSQPIYSEENPGPNGETFSARKFTLPSLSAAADTLRGMKQTGKAFDFPAVYAAAASGQSSRMLPLDSLYEQAKKQVPTLTTAEFGKQVKALYDDGRLYLEPGDSPASMTAALEKYGLRDSLGIPSMYAGPVDMGETMALRSGDFSARMSAAFSPFQRSPELRMAIAQVAKARAQNLGAEWIEKSAVIRSAASIGQEARMREALAYETRMNEYLDGLTEAARQDLEFEPAELADDPLISAMLIFGKLMSFTTAKRMGKVDAKAGDYDGAPWLPPSFFSSGGSVRWAEVTKDGVTTTYTKEIPNDVMDDIKSGKATLKRKSRSIPATGGIMPDQMAQAMYDAGLLPDAYADTLWQALASRIESTRKDKARAREAAKAYKDAQKYARDASRAEADKWAEGATKQAGSPKAQREMLKAALRTLDGILSAAPPEVRARVGGYVKLAGLATDEAMLKEIESRIEKLNVELEKWLKKEGVEQLQKLLKKGRPTMDSGKKGKGKDADLHALFSLAESASEMRPSQVAGKLAEYDDLILNGKEVEGSEARIPLSDQEEVMILAQRGIVELLGDLKHADSGRVFSALDTLKSIYDGAWLKWKLAEIERKEKRAGLRHDFITDTGKVGLLPERQQAQKVAITLLGKIKGGFLSLSSFHEVLSYAFGSKSARVKSLVDAEREAAGQYEDVNQALADEVEALFTDMAGGTLAGERLRFDMAQPSIKTGKGEFSQLQAIQALLMWRQEDGRRHMEGTFDESGKPSGAWNYDQAWIDEITAGQTAEARRLMSWIMQKYGAEWGALNTLYRERYGVNMPAHDNYAPITVAPMQSKAGEVVDPVTGAAMSSGSILTPGSLRTRSRNAIAEPEFRDALQTLLVHTRQLEYWKAYYDLAVEANAILGNREVLNAVKAKGGEQAATALRKWVDAIAQGGFRDASSSLEINKIMSRMTGRAASVGLLGRFSTLLVQSTQLAAASVKMPLGAYLRGMSKLLTGNLQYGDAIKSPFIQRRFKSAPPIVRQAMESLGAASKPNHITRAARGLGQLLSGADALFTAGTYALLLDYHRGTGRALGLSGAELEQHANTEAERDTEQVAQPTRMAARSLAEITMTNPLAKVSWAYASEARQKIALAAWSATEAASNPAQFAKTMFLVFGVGGLMTQLLKNLWKEAKGDDDEKKWSPERMVMAALAGPLHGLPLASELSGDSGMLSGAIWAWSALKDIVSGEGDMRDVDTLLSTMGYFNDTAAGIASLSHAGLDFAKVLKNLTE